MPVPLGAKILHCSMRRSCTARCEGLALLGARSLHRSVRRSCTARCEGLAPLGTRPQSSNDWGFQRGNPFGSARKRVGVVGEGKNYRSERGFVPSPTKALTTLQFIANQNNQGLRGNAPYKTLDIGNLLPPNQYCDTILPQGVVYESFSY